MAREALTLHIRGILEDGGTVPAPAAIDDIAGDPDRKGAVAFLVNPDADEAVQFKITARKSQIELIDRLADEAGMTRSAFMVQASTSPTRAKRSPRPKAAARSNRTRFWRS